MHQFVPESHFRAGERLLTAASRFEFEFIHDLLGSEAHRAKVVFDLAGELGNATGFQRFGIGIGPLHNGPHLAHLDGPARRKFTRQAALFADLAQPLDTVRDDAGFFRFVALADPLIARIFVASPP